MIEFDDNLNEQFIPEAQVRVVTIHGCLGAVYECCPLTWRGGADLKVIKSSKEDLMMYLNGRKYRISKSRVWQASLKKRKVYDER